MNPLCWLLLFFFFFFFLHCFRTDCCFSPDDRLVLTGTSVKKEEGNGKLVFFDRTSFQRVHEVEVTNAVSLSTTIFTSQSWW